MAMFQQLSCGELAITGAGRAVKVFTGSSVTRAAVLAEVGNSPARGSVYISTDRSYNKVAEAGTATDWEKVTTSAAD
jgi:hypothetical protein